MGVDILSGLCYSVVEQLRNKYATKEYSENMEPESCAKEEIHREAVDAAKEAALSDDTYMRLASLFRLFGDPTRVRILHALEPGELCVCDLAALLGLSKSAVSHQLNALRLANLVTFHRKAQNVFYSLADSHVNTLIDVGLEHLLE